MPTQSPHDTTVDFLVVGAGTGMAAALAAHESGMSTLLVEKTEALGGSTALSGGAFWVPGNSVLREQGQVDSDEAIRAYLSSCVGDSTRPERWQAFADHGPAAVAMLRRMTPLDLMWSKGYSDYHPELPGGSSTGRTAESKPFDLNVLGDDLQLLRRSAMRAPVPMPITGVDYRLMNLMAKIPHKGLLRVLKRLAQGLFGKARGKEYAAGGTALAAGLLAGVSKAGIPVWTNTPITRLLVADGRVTGAVFTHQGKEVTVQARKGVVLSAGGFDHNMELRHKYQSAALEEWTMGSPGNTGDTLAIGQEVGAATELLDQVWWFPAVAPVKEGMPPGVMLAERSLPGSFIVDQTGQRFINESIDYMSFGQEVLCREKDGDPVESMWIIFDQEYRNSYVFAAQNFPRQPLPDRWYEKGIAHKASSARELAAKIGVPVDAFAHTFDRFNVDAALGHDGQFRRGDSAYDRYYGDPTVQPNPNLRPLNGDLYAVKMVLGDLGTCGGLKADGRGRVLREDDSVIEGLYATGNAAGNAFGNRYPGAGATIGQGVVYGYIAARDAAGKL